MCGSCHSHRDWSHQYGPVDGPMGGGSDSTQVAYGLPPGTVLWSPNLTPTGVGDWTDAELARALTGGLSRDGHALFPVMPYDRYATLADDDVASLVAWMRALSPAPDEVPDRSLPLPLALGVRQFPRPPALVDTPPADPVGAGAYLADAASCVWCHSAVDFRGNLVPGRILAGGHRFVAPPPGAGTVVAPNITPDATGIGSWTREQFIARFRGLPPGLRVPVVEGGFASPMPWLAYRGMTEADLGALYDYLRTVPAVASEPGPRYEPP